MEKWLITGANGNLGRRLIGRLLGEAQPQVVAVVRSTRAQEQIESLDLTTEQKARLQVRVLDYTDVDALTEAAQGCNKAVHLVGILKETRQASYQQAHEASTQALLAALQDSTVDHVTYLSIIGSAPGASNTCLASKGRAEQLLLQAPLKACVLRVPMVLGEGDYASFALAQRAARSRSLGFRVASLEQPIYAGDVVDAVMRAASLGLDAALNLAGPQSITRRDLTRQAARMLGRPDPIVVSLPMWVGLAVAAIMEKVMNNPPVTVAMLDVLDHDDNIDPQPSLQQLGMQLTSLEDTLKAVLRSG